MNTVLKFMMGTLLAFALSACSQETTEKKVDDMNGKISRLNTISVALAQDGISLNDGYSFSSRSSSRTLPSNMSNEKAAYVRGLLSEYVSLGNQVLMRVNDKDVFFTDSAKLKTQVSNAQSYLNQMTNYEARRDAQKRTDEQNFERRRNSGEKLHIALDEMKKAETLESEIRSRYSQSVASLNGVTGLERMDTRKLENLRDDTMKLMGHTTKAQSLVKEIDRSSMPSATAVDRAIRALESQSENLEKNLSKMNRELSKRTGDPRPDLDRTKPRIQ